MFLFIIIFHLIVLSSILLSEINCNAAGFLFAPKIDSIQLVFDGMVAQVVLAVPEEMAVLVAKIWKVKNGSGSTSKNGSSKNR